ncbi:catalase-like domain-containing protein [Coprinopsis sp. MPI-PUGE-AT-0042]|nr:catalase-like domain-containing protein [Coprinopsis sp. MPI-PUGE-AT-0042]
MFWDYLSQNPESIHQVMILFSDRGTPDGYHQEHGYSGHTFKWVKDDGSFVYTQVHLRADKGFKTLDVDTATKLAGENPDYATGTLVGAVESKNYPVWNVFVQTMTPEQAESFRYNILDLTKIWPHSEFPLRPVGKLVLDENPQNYFAEIERIAFSPSHVIPHIEPSADPQLPVNAPIVPVANFQRAGPMTFVSQGPRPNYQSTIQPLQYKCGKADMNACAQDLERQRRHENFIGGAWRDLSEITELDFEQPRALWTKVSDDKAKAAYVKNVSGHLGTVKSNEIKARQLAVYAAVDQGLSDRIANAIGHPTVSPLQVKPSSEAVKYRANFRFVPDLSKLRL